MKKIETYKHNRLARAYNKSLSPRDPVLVGAAGGAIVGAALSSTFRASTAHELAQRTIGGALGGAAGGALAGRSRRSFQRGLRNLHERQQGRPAQTLHYM